MIFDAGSLDGSDFLMHTIRISGRYFLLLVHLKGTVLSMIDAGIEVLRSMRQTAGIDKTSAAWCLNLPTLPYRTTRAIDVKVTVLSAPSP